MGCLYCRKNIGPLRAIKDRSFCSDEHRAEYAAKSARALREADDLYGFDTTEGHDWRSITAIRPEDRFERRGGMGLSVSWAFWSSC